MGERFAARRTVVLPSRVARMPGHDLLLRLAPTPLPGRIPARPTSPLPQVVGAGPNQSGAFLRADCPGRGGRRCGTPAVPADPPLNLRMCGEAHHELAAAARSRAVRT